MPIKHSTANLSFSDHKLVTCTISLSYSPSNNKSWDKILPTITTHWKFEKMVQDTFIQSEINQADPQTTFLEWGNFKSRIVKSSRHLTSQIIISSKSKVRKLERILTHLENNRPLTTSYKWSTAWNSTKLLFLTFNPIKSK